MTESNFFKLDGLIVKDEPRSFYFMVNFNVPLRHLTNDKVLPEKYEVIRKCLLDEFDHEIKQGELTYSISANYDLVNKRSNETKLWEGSFQDRTNQEFYIKENVSFEPDSFVAQALEFARVDNVVQHLTWAGLNSEWTFSKLNSVIFVFQTRCYYTKHRFRSESLILPNNRYKDLEQNRRINFTKYLEQHKSDEPDVP